MDFKFKLKPSGRYSLLTDVTGAIWVDVYVFWRNAMWTWK